MPTGSDHVGLPGKTGSARRRKSALRLNTGQDAAKTYGSRLEMRDRLLGRRRLLFVSLKAHAADLTGCIDDINSLSGSRRVWQFCDGAMEPRVTSSVFGVEVEMQLFTLSITDLISSESVPHEEWAEKDDLFEIGNRFARAMLAANPNFRHRGMCVAVYDEAGMAVSVMPLDTLQ